MVYRILTAFVLMNAMFNTHKVYAGGSYDSIPGWHSLAEKFPEQVIEIDKNVKRSGEASAMLHRPPSISHGVVQIVQYISADKFRGQRVRMSVYVKSQDVNSAFLYLKTSGEGGPLTFANTKKDPIEETMDWKLYQITLDVPQETICIVFGTILMKDGILWLDDCLLEIVDKTVPSDDMLVRRTTKVLEKFSQLHRMNPLPRNMGFEEK